MFNWVSKNTPKFLTLLDGFIAVSPTVIPFDLNLDTWRGVPMIDNIIQTQELFLDNIIQTQSCVSVFG